MTGSAMVSPSLLCWGIAALRVLCCEIPTVLQPTSGMLALWGSSCHLKSSFILTLNLLFTANITMGTDVGNKSNDTRDINDKGESTSEYFRCWIKAIKSNTTYIILTQNMQGTIAMKKTMARELSALTSDSHWIGMLIMFRPGNDTQSPEWQFCLMLRSSLKMYT